MQPQESFNPNTFLRSRIFLLGISALLLLVPVLFFVQELFLDNIISAASNKGFVLPTFTLLAVVGTIYFFQRPRQAFFVILAIRLQLDLLWWLPIEIGPLNLLGAFTGGVTVLGSVLFVLRFTKDIEKHPSIHLFLAFSLILILGSIRALNPQIMIDEFFRLYSPLLMFFLATSLMNQRGDAEKILLLFAISGVVPLLCSAYHLADGQMNEIYLNGSNRLLGGYQNLRNHALMMLIFSCCGVYFFFRLERKRYKFFTAIYTFLSLYFLYLTFTRATLIVFGLFLITYLYMSGRRLLMATCLIGVTCVLFLSPSLQSRFYDFVRLFSLITATNQDLKALSSLGSGRYGLWSSSLFAYLQSPFYDIVLGLGLGHHWVLTRGAYSGFILIKGGFVDTHNDMLRILYQLGPIALGLFLGIACQCIQAGRWLIQNAKNFWHRELGALIISLTLCILMNNALSNGINSRTTFGWSFWIIAATGFIMKRELLNRQLRSSTRNTESSEDMAQPS